MKRIIHSRLRINFKSDTKQYIELDDTNVKYASTTLFPTTGTTPTVEFTPLSSTTITSSSSSSSSLLSSPTFSQCVGCGLIIYDPFMLNVQPNLKWHIRCLNCSKCLRSLMNDSTCFVRDCKAYCREDYFNTFLYRCAGCYRSIDKMDLVFRIRSRTFHLDCFRCVICEKLLQPGEEIAYRNEQVYCLIHSHLIEKFPKITHPSHNHENDNNNNNNNNNNTLHIDNNTDMETLQFISGNHLINNANNGNNTNNDGNPVRVNNIDLHDTNQPMIEQVEINIIPGTNLVTNTTCYKTNSNINMNPSKFTNHCHESLITDDMRSLKSDIKGLLPNLLSHQTDDIQQLMTMKSIYCNNNNTTNTTNNNNIVTSMDLTPDMEDGVIYENLCNSTSTTISMPTVHTNVTFTNMHNHISNNSNNGNNYMNKLINNQNSICNSSFNNPLNENTCPNSPDSSFGAIIQDIDSPMSDSSDDLSREDEDFSLLGMSESNTTGLSENGIALNGSNSLPMNNNNNSNNNNTVLNHNLYGNFNQNHLMNIGGSGSLTGSTSSSGTSVTSVLGDEVVHSIVISRGTNGLNNGSCGISGIGSRPSSGKSGGSKRSKDQKTTRVRTVLNEKQLHTLRTCYAANPRPDALMKEQLVEMTSLSPRVIRVWFQNKRCKDKKRQLLLKQMEQHQQNGGRPGSLHGISMIAQSPVRNDMNLMCANSGIDVHHIPGPYWTAQNVQNDLNSRYRSHSPSNLLTNQPNNNNNNNNNKLIRHSIENTTLSTSSPNSLINYHTNSLNEHTITNYTSGCLLNSNLSNLIPPPPTIPQSSTLTRIPGLLSNSSIPSCISSPPPSSSSSSSSLSSGQNFNCIQSNNLNNSSLNLSITGTTATTATTTNDNSTVNHLKCNSLVIPSNGNNVNTTINSNNNTTTTTNTNSNNATSNNSTNVNQTHFLNERSAPPFQQLVRIF
ncbi:unnamed protein product [Schistosoma turkestanicum]|nr:unnamed protein product [Schistosoma turkestanicum]